VGDAVCVDTLAKWKTNFNQLHANLLGRLDPALQTGKVLIAGGSCLHALTKGVHGGEGAWGPTSDVDIFLHSCTAPEATALAKTIFDAVATDFEAWTVHRGSGVLSMIQHGEFEFQRGNVWLGEDPSLTSPDLPLTFHDLPSQPTQRRNAQLETVQVVLRLYDSPAEILLGFDVDCVCLGYDGTNLWALPRALRALETGTNVLNPLHAWPVRASYEFRLAKYAWRGFPVAVPGLDTGKVDFEQVCKPMGELSGLARLLHINLALEFAPAISGNAECNGLEPKLIVYNTKLSAHYPGSHSEEDRVALFLSGGSGYGPDVTTGKQVILPACFSGREDYWVGHSTFERIGTFRNEAWNEIVDAGDGHDMDHVPRRLLDAWDASRRSREYLNASEHDCDAKYYAHAMPHVV